ncbi:hypothetical protein MMC28_000501 [Mycoblastus sanguinarius]|nr:hypothetical protein [Mycoblastus sanguinarius]
MSFNMETTGDEVVKTFAAEAKGKTVLITGPSESGLGAQTAIFLAAGKPKLIILAGRTQSKIQPVIDQIKKEHPDVDTKYVKLDLADQSSVQAAAKEVNGAVKKLDFLINNAGVMAIKTYTTTAEGIETQFGANHIGHFLLTKLLMPKILAAGKGARVINVGSFGYLTGGVRFDDHNFQNGKDYNPWTAYGQSKTSNMLFTKGLARKLEGKEPISLVLNPGLIFESKLMTDVNQEMFMEGHAITTKNLNGAPMPDITPKSLAAGSATVLYAALDPSLEAHSGAFLSDCAIYTATPTAPHAIGEDKEDKLWALSEKLTGENFTVG